MSYYIELTAVSDMELLQSDWTKLEANADCSYFQSWGWIGVWLKEVVADMRPQVIRVWEREELVAIGILINTSVTRRGILSSRKLFLNEAPVNNRNMIIEYNGLVLKRGHEEGVYKAVIYHLRYADANWDELCLGLVRKSITDTFLGDLDTEFYLTIENRVSSWQFDSEKIEQGMSGICHSLSRNRRYQINKALKVYRKEGDIVLEEAKTVEQAQDYFDGLKKLHTLRWVARGKTGSFANPVWENFHRQMINTRFSCGEIQLVKVATPSRTIGYIYSFLWRGRVYVLQTGFNMDIPKNGQPGYISHMFGILHNQKKGYEIYDLLSEDSGYKKILCNSSEELITVCFKRIAVKSMLRQVSVSALRSGYISTVVKSSITDKINVYGSGTLDTLREKWIRLINKWPSQERKYLLVGSESSGTTAVSDLLFKEVSNLRYLEEGEQQWVWEAYRGIYQKKTKVRDYPRLQLFDAIKVPGFSMIINEFLTEFPNTTIVYLVRDPRDFASSAIKTWKIGKMKDFHKVPWTKIEWLGVNCEDPVKCLALRWKAYLNAAKKIDNVVFIKYEDFCQDKVGVIEGICKKLDLPFDMSRVSQLCDTQLSHASVRAYRPTGPGGWRDSILEEKHVKSIEKICEKEMKDWGYEFSRDSDFLATKNEVSGG
ncbi:MAG: GNAT family N-acetyltransferase [Gammaproteobacteria bacterium]|nr:GNAT family N-acetyltransferase [Gammaproteobacteria bacterium]